jgi:DNA repair protein RadC
MYGTVRRVESRLADVVCEIKEAAGSDCRNPETVAELVGHLRDEAVEVFAALLLNGKHRVTGYVEVSRGTLTASLVHPREVFGPALRLGAAAVVVVHNHPSGDPEPSGEDLSVTRRLIGCGELLGVPLLDHVVLGDGERLVSIRNRIAWKGGE